MGNSAHNKAQNLVAEAFNLIYEDGVADGKGSAKQLADSDRKMLTAQLRRAYGHAAKEPNMARDAIDEALSLLFRIGVLNESQAATPEPYEMPTVTEAAV